MKTQQWQIFLTSLNLIGLLTPLPRTPVLSVLMYSLRLFSTVFNSVYSEFLTTKNSLADKILDLSYAGDIQLCDKSCVL